MPEIALYLLKNRKNLPALCDPPPVPSLWQISPVGAISRGFVYLLEFLTSWTI